MLKNRFLLMDADDNDYRDTRVKMHDVVRVMALLIASRDKYWFMVSHYQEAWSEHDSPKKCTCISVILDEEAVLPTTLKYPSLQALNLEIPYSNARTRLPEIFFYGTRSLRFLRIRNGMLSPTLRMLTQLRVLNLPYYKSEMICEIGELVNLEILRLQSSNIKMLPKEIGALTKLQLLDLNYSFSLKNIAPGVLSKLSKLEELGLCSCPIEWEVEESGSERSNARLTEVFSLRNLRFLEIQIEGFELIPQDTGHLNDVTCYSIKIGKPSPSFTSEEIRNEKCMIIQVGDRHAGEHGMSVLFVGVERLSLFACGTKHIIDLLTRQGFQNLEELEINNKVVSEVGTEIFYRDVLLTDIPMWLHTLKITSFQGFRTLFSYDVFRGLENLRVLDVSNCLMLEEIVDLEQNEERQGSAMIDKTIIPRLQTLKLSELPKIRYFCTFSNRLELPLLEELNIRNCPMMEAFAFESFDNSMPNPIPSVFFSKEVICPNLRELVVVGPNVTTTMFSHEIPTASFNALRRLEVVGCFNLKSLFSPAMFRELANLEELSIWYCKMLEEVIGEENKTVHVGEVQEMKVVWKLPKLKLLDLCRLLKMVRFSYLQSDLELPSLERITICECPKVKSSLSLMSLKCLPNGVRVKGISMPKFSSSRFFVFDKELTEEEDSLNHYCFKFFQGDLSFTSRWWGEPELRLWSNEFFFSDWESAHNEIEIKKLTVGITYEIVFVIMLVKEEYSNVHSGMKLIINVASDVREVDMTDRLKEQWIEILGGEFTPTSGQHGQLRFSIAKSEEYQNRAILNGVILNGVYIRPKRISG